MLAARGAGHRRRCGTCGGTHRLYERLSGLLLSSDVLIESPIGAFFLPFGMARARPGAEPFFSRPPSRRRSPQDASSG